MRRDNLPHATRRRNEALDPRVAWIQTCEIRGADGGPTRGQVWNLSGAGAYLAAEPVPEVGQTLAISFALPDGSTFRGVARVVWRNPTSPWSGPDGAGRKLPAGCGVEFLSWLRGPDAHRPDAEDGWLPAHPASAHGIGVVRS
jgi:hypothetical protein